MMTRNPCYRWLIVFIPPAFFSRGGFEQEFLWIFRPSPGHVRQARRALLYDAAVSLMRQWLNAGRKIWEVDWWGVGYRRRRVPLLNRNFGKLLFHKWADAGHVTPEALTIGDLGNVWAQPSRMASRNGLGSEDGVSLP